VYPEARHARAAIAEFDGANANGQPISLALVPQAGARSLFQRVDAAERRRRTAPTTDTEEDEDGGQHRRNRVRGPPPDNIDRYVPGMDDTDGDGPPARGGRGRRGPSGGGGRGGMRANGAGAERRRNSPRRENDGGRRPGQRRGGAGGRGEERDADGHPVVHGRPRKTAEELDAEMADYWGGAAGGVAASVEGNGAAPATDDVDMDII
jgi:THO complex subunit 4